MKKKPVTRRSFLEIVVGVAASFSFLGLVSCSDQSTGGGADNSASDSDQQTSTTDSDSSDQSGRANSASDSDQQTSTTDSDSSDQSGRSASDSDSSRSDQSGGEGTDNNARR